MEVLCEMASYYVTQNTLNFAFPYVSPSFVSLACAISPSNLWLTLHLGLCVFYGHIIASLFHLYTCNSIGKSSYLINKKWLFYILNVLPTMWDGIGKNWKSLILKDLNLPRERKLWIIVNHHVNARNWSYILHKWNQYSLNISHTSAFIL